MERDSFGTCSYMASSSDASGSAERVSWMRSSSRDWSSLPRLYLRISLSDTGLRPGSFSSTTSTVTLKYRLTVIEVSVTST